ncbi:MAG TPA: hypothetical protein VLU46_09290, partial [Thermoanaerobaculia bacterium]|nr:hypothetical protein [Thermoanaerobaculia bacterium]
SIDATITCTGWPASLGVVINAVDGVDTTLRKDLARIDGSISILEVSVAPETTLGVAIPKLRALFNAVMSNLDALRTEVDRWARIITSHGAAELHQELPLASTSVRYTVSVLRTLANQPANPAPPPETIATMIFEGHSKARLNFGLGVAQTFGRRSTTYDIVKTVQPDKSVAGMVITKTEQQTLTKPVATIGVYFPRAVDELTRTRGSFILSIGSEISSSPDYFLGIGYDLPIGLTISVGASEYQTSTLAKNFDTTRPIPVDSNGNLVITSVPTTSKSACAPYLSFAFRPAIFQFFSKLVKGSS